MVKNRVKAPNKINTTAINQIEIGIPKLISAGSKYGILSKIKYLK
jgi:hypothetical protein